MRNIVITYAQAMQAANIRKIHFPVAHPLFEVSDSPLTTAIERQVFSLP